MSGPVCLHGVSGEFASGLVSPFSLFSAMHNRILAEQLYFSTFYERCQGFAQVVFGKSTGSTTRGGGVFFHREGTLGIAARKVSLFRTSSLAKGILFDNFSLDKGTLFSNFRQRKFKFW